MTLMEAAKKWSLSPNWVRELIKSKRLPATLMKTGPVPYYDIPNNTPKPQSMQKAPFRKGTADKAPRAAKAKAPRAHGPKKAVTKKKVAPKK